MKCKYIRNQTAPAFHTGLRLCNSHYFAQFPEIHGPSCEFPVEDLAFLKECAICKQPGYQIPELQTFWHAGKSACVDCEMQLRNTDGGDPFYGTSDLTCECCGLSGLPAHEMSWLFNLTCGDCLACLHGYKHTAPWCTSDSE